MSSSFFKLFDKNDPNKPVSAKRPDGYAYATGPLGVEEIDTLQCVHCGQHWEHKPGSGIVRGWCSLCNGPFCGVACKEHFPLEKRFDLYEKGLLPDLLAPKDMILPEHKRIIIEG